MEKIVEKLVKIIGSVQWEGLRQRLTGRRYGLRLDDFSRIHNALVEGPHVILTWRRAHMSSYFVVIAHFILTGRIVRWSHVLLSIVEDAKVKGLEATGKGVTVTGFFEVFNCDAVCILRPRISDKFDWAAAVAAAREDLGKKYDNLCRLDDDSQLNCAELVLGALKRDPEFHARFHGLEAMIKNEGNLTPPMFLESGSFDVVLEIRR